MNQQRFFALADKPYELFVKYKLAWPILIGIVVYFAYTLSTKESTSRNILDPNTYSMKWRSPNSEEIVNIGRLMVKSNLKGCGEYYLISLEESEYVIACTPDGQNWNYYLSWPKQEKIYKANDEMLSKLSPPY